MAKASTELPATDVRLPGEPRSLRAAVSPWQDFVLRHTRPVNLWIHALSYLMFVGGPLLALSTGSPWWLAALFASGGVGAAGHYVSGDSNVSLREATVDVRVPWYVTRMFAMIAARAYAEEIRNAKLAYRRSRGAPHPTARG